jgi:hypothetical protein
MENWIKVEDRLPDNMQDVLMYDKNRGRIIGFYSGDQWSDDQRDYRQVTHWMPLPDPPPKPKASGKLVTWPLGGN